MTTAAQQPADVLVVFGITGDLAKVMTFRSLYRLEQRGLLNCPIVGVAVDDWTVDDLRAHARSAIEGPGETIDEEVFARFAARLSYVTRRLRRPRDLRARRQGARRDASSPVFYLEIPPSLFGMVVKGLAGAGLTENARVSSSRSRSATTSRRRARSADEIHQHLDESSSTGSTTSSGRWASPRSSTCASPTRCSSRSGTATTSPACRSRWPRTSASTTAATSTTRSARCATSSSTT